MNAFAKIQRGTLKALLSLPPWAQEKMATDINSWVDGLHLAPDAQMLLHLRNLRTLPSYSDLTHHETRAFFRGFNQILEGPDPALLAVRDLVLPRPTGPLAMRFYTPFEASDPGALLVYFHGGGFVDGTIATHDPLCRMLCSCSSTRILSVGYRCAPEFIFPAAVDDAYAAFSWARKNAEKLGSSPELVGVGGDSSGGNLSAVISHLCASNHDHGPAFQFLLYPLCDVSYKRDSYSIFGEGYGLTNEIYDWYMARYLPADADRTDPRVSPMLSEYLSSFPPTYIAASGFDILRDECSDFAQLLEAKGVEVEFDLFEGTFHGYARFFHLLNSARSAVEKSGRSLHHLGKRAMSL